MSIICRLDIEGAGDEGGWDDDEESESEDEGEDEGEGDDGAGVEAGDDSDGDIISDAEEVVPEVEDVVDVVVVDGQPLDEGIISVGWVDDEAGMDDDDRETTVEGNDDGKPDDRKGVDEAPAPAEDDDGAGEKGDGTPDMKEGKGDGMDEDDEREKADDEEGVGVWVGVKR